MINCEGATVRDVEVSAGPFEREPVELGDALSEGFDPAVSGEEIQRRTADWLLATLDRYYVELGDGDRAVVVALADEGWNVVQVVAGWVRRAAEVEGGS